MPETILLNQTFPNWVEAEVIVLGDLSLAINAHLFIQTAVQLASYSLARVMTQRSGAFSLNVGSVSLVL